MLGARLARLTRPQKFNKARVLNGQKTMLMASSSIRLLLPALISDLLSSFIRAFLGVVLLKSDPEPPVLPHFKHQLIIMSLAVLTSI